MYLKKPFQGISLSAYGNEDVILYSIDSVVTKSLRKSERTKKHEITSGKQWKCPVKTDQQLHHFLKDYTIELL